MLERIYIYPEIFIWISLSVVGGDAPKSIYDGEYFRNPYSNFQYPLILVRRRCKWISIYGNPEGERRTKEEILQILSSELIHL